MLEVCPTIAAGRPQRARSTRCGIGGREDPVRLVFDAAPGPAVVLGLADLGDRFRLVANEIDVVDAAAAAAATAGGPRGLAPAARPADLGRGAGSPPAAPHHTVLSHGGRRRGAAPTSPRWSAPSCWSSTPTPTRRRFANELRWNQAYYRLARGF